MPTLHRTILAATKEAVELLDRYKQTRAYVVQSENVYGNEPGFEALISSELPVKPNIVAYLGKHKPLDNSQVAI